MTTYWLSTHLAYACRHSGACCRARWPIPIERSQAASVQAAIDAGQLAAPLEWYHLDAAAPADIAGILTLQPTGACVFHRASDAATGPPAPGCAIHPIRPIACAHFPYVCVIDARGVHVTLSHFCPSAAQLLFATDTQPEIVEGPAVFGSGRVPEGLDARDALPPAVEGPGPSRLMSWDAVTAFEREYVASLGGDRSVPAPPSVTEFERARAAAAPDWDWPAAPENVAAAWDRFVAPAWPQWTPCAGRYLAARAHASWAMYLGRGPRDVRRSVDLARTVLQVELVRQCLATNTLPTRATLETAIRQSDLLLLHHADPSSLTRPGLAPLH